jgi:hypothetical protein
MGRKKLKSCELLQIEAEEVIKWHRPIFSNYVSHFTEDAIEIRDVLV